VLRTVLKTVLIVGCAIAYMIVASLAIAATNPLVEPQSLSHAESAAARDAARRDRSSVCGIEIPDGWKVALASGEGSFAAVGSSVATAECLHRRGYLSTAGLFEVRAYHDAREWEWWEKSLYWIGLLVLLAGLSWRFFGPRAPRAVVAAN
jgi:hypothetical protein